MALSKLFIVTGTSSGIGKALVELLLEKDHEVIGIGRSKKVEDVRYQHVQLDLSNAEAVLNFCFKLPEAEEIFLINNAGTIGEIKRQGFAKNELIQDVFQVNLISPAILMNKFIEYCQKLGVKGTILNVSSGAGKRPIDAWAPYCASKAGLDLFSETISLEQGYCDNLIRVYSVAPGVIDTPMQELIRSKSIEEFSQVESFRSLKRSEKLVPPEEVAQCYYNVILNPSHNQPVVFSLRDRIKR